MVFSAQYGRHSPVPCEHAGTHEGLLHCWQSFGMKYVFGSGKASSATDEKSFGTWSQFKKGILKEMERKTF